jgi:hypothetical protein
MALNKKLLAKEYVEVLGMLYGTKQETFAERMYRSIGNIMWHSTRNFRLKYIVKYWEHFTALNKKFLSKECTLKYL